MCLLDVYELTFSDFFDEDRPDYYILSHRWFGADDEVSYEDFIEEFCYFIKARNERSVRRTNWAWVDTCCIDKRSSAELTEAINSMINWYAEASDCVAYLWDVDTSESLRKSDWWSRGWSKCFSQLRELLAPRTVLFVDRGWDIEGHKCAWNTINDSGDCVVYASEALAPPHRGRNLNSQRSNITGIQEEYRNVFATLAIYWAAIRRTSRIEDQAYSLFGLFDVNLPLLYGERSHCHTIR
ncbi:hypothetical protein BAUCODRAFT_123137 [Baudoinia panamericana UAMH 10762]|uniref:Heterokaryon incompatibility domain-containing protein n=1 Tax=Baudoinia panamericana (strain UAMH 10762) TaxID=717646 RepID=M2N9P1_BAUPA|nr:uncharacterized protein BAUCODRAFT_123137 [Baudoinia panamericana UAMH 10762]EMC95844.1 hypothetical protein BAUCODRAFT_123137 [Baudoinia panamericana UAMH 10762]